MSKTPKKAFGFVVMVTEEALEAMDARNREGGMQIDVTEYAQCRFVHMVEAEAAWLRGFAGLDTEDIRVQLLEVNVVETQEGEAPDAPFLIGGN